MLSKKQVFALCSLVALIAILATSAILAQEAAEEKIACDSTLAVLLLAAEHDFDYLSGKLMSEDMMDHPALKIDTGQYAPLVEEVMNMMMAMMEEDPMMGMTPEQMAAHDEMLARMMEMAPADAVKAYMESMNMAMDDSMMTMLAPGNIAGENPTCAEVRADVEKFIVAHIITEMSMMMGQ